MKMIAMVNHIQERVLCISLFCALTGTLAGCGGGGGGGEPSATPTSSASNSSSRQITPQSLASCPTDTLSPADMNKLSCLVGHADGLSNRQTDPKPCSLDVGTDGKITITTVTGSRTYVLSKGAGTFKTGDAMQATEFSEFQGRTATPSGDIAGYDAETWMLGSRSGTQTLAGVVVPSTDQDEIKISYFGPATSGSAMKSFLIVGAFRDAQKWIPDMMTCDIRW